MKETTVINGKTKNKIVNHGTFFGDFNGLREIFWTNVWKRYRLDDFVKGIESYELIENRKAFKFCSWEFYLAEKGWVGFSLIDCVKINNTYDSGKYELVNTTQGEVNV